MNEILPGVFHWSVLHEKIGIPVHSCFLRAAGVLIDPMVPAGGLDALERHGTPRHALLTNRHHYRHSGRFAERFGVEVRCHRAGLHEFTRGERVEPFEPGDELPGGIRVVEVGVLCPEETAFHLPPRRGETGGGLLAMGDAVIRGEDGELRFVPDEYMDDADAVKRGLRQAFRRLGELRFDTLLLAHGEPLAGNGREALRAFARG
ncbi:MAG TPA: hypothetical protein VIC56_08135 [Gemmatimonadota bacterium]|jgi:hypothetical protein